MPSVTLSNQLTRGNESLRTTKTYTEDGITEHSFSVNGNVTNQLVALALDVSQAKVIWLQADGGNLTLKTNSTTSPGATIELVNGIALPWTSDSGQDNPFGSTDVTALYITNANPGPVTFNLRILFDPTV